MDLILRLDRHQKEPTFAVWTLLLSYVLISLSDLKSKPKTLDLVIRRFCFKQLYPFNKSVTADAHDLFLSSFFHSLDHSYKSVFRIIALSKAALAFRKKIIQVRIHLVKSLFIKFWEIQQDANWSLVKFFSFSIFFFELTTTFSKSLGKLSSVR